jgi:tetratricopeptide (TPR) repeat protein
VRESTLSTLAVFCLLAGATGAAHAATTPACDQAIERFEATFKERSDDEALAAARALEEPCAKPDAAYARALSRQGYLYFHRHDLRTAVTAYEEAARLDPTNATLRMSLCGVYTEAKRYDEAVKTCVAGLDLAKTQDDGSVEKHGKVLDIGFNLVLAKTRRGDDVCDDHSVIATLEAYRAAHPDHAWVHQLLGAWAWDCEKSFDKGFALYKKSCALGWQAACDQVAYTEACQCKERQQR